MILKGYWHSLIGNWSWVYGASLAELFLGAVIIALTNPSSGDTTIYYIQSGPLVLVWFLLFCSMPCMLLGVILYFVHSKRPIRFMLLMIGSVFLAIAAIFVPPADGHFERNHLAGARFEGHVYYVAGSTSWSYYPASWILFQCDWAGIRCSELHRDTKPPIDLSVDGAPEVTLVTEMGALSVVIAGKTVYTWVPGY